MRERTPTQEKYSEASVNYKTITMPRTSTQERAAPNSSDLKVHFCGQCWWREADITTGAFYSVLL